MTSEQFRLARLALGWTKRECAKRLGVHEKTIYRWERRSAPTETAAFLMQRLSR
ncbi:helix-turn-helix domain-containing protein [Companilactobacillus sp.]|uniref:helix-turn-helix domain-containing protein n=1 Tax=Companilactobacillus sp. TaxID=2767905 RepID=UPI003455BCC7